MFYVTSSFIKDYSSDGWAFEIINLLKNNNIPFNISLNSFIEDHSFNKLNTFTHSSRSPNDFQLVINPACFLPQFTIDNKTIIYTMWDSSILPIEYVNTINKCQLVIVPSNETKKVFMRSGVSRPIEVIPHGFDRLSFYPKDNYNNNYGYTFIFGASGQIVSPKNDKKDLDKVISCFKTAFQNNENVELQLKITNESKSNIYIKHDERITYIKNTYANSNMPNWYRGLNCYVNLSKYEAFGRQPMEAMACGIPIITTNASGISDYYSNDMGYTIGHEEVAANCDPYVEGHWYEANEDEVVSQMRYVYKNQTEAYNTGAFASQMIQPFENANWHAKMLHLIKRYLY